MIKGMLREVTEASVDYLQTRAEFRSAGLTILARYKGAIGDIIDTELGKLGLYIYVWPVRPLKCWQNGPGLYFDELAWRAEIGENPTLNSTGFSAEYAAELVALHMMNWEPKLHAIQTFFPTEDVIAEAEDPDLNAYFVNLKTSGGLPQIP